MKYSICNVQLLPKAADLRKKAFDELRLNMLIDLLYFLSRNVMKSWLTSSTFLIPSFPGLYRMVSVSLAWRPKGTATDHKKSDGGGRENQKTKISSKKKCPPKTFMQSETQRKNFMHDREVLSFSVPPFFKVEQKKQSWFYSREYIFLVNNISEGSGPSFLLLWSLLPKLNLWSNV